MLVVALSISPRPSCGLLRFRISPANRPARLYLFFADNLSTRCTASRVSGGN